MAASYYPSSQQQQPTYASSVGPIANLASPQPANSLQSHIAPPPVAPPVNPIANHPHPIPIAHPNPSPNPIPHAHPHRIPVPVTVPVPIPIATPNPNLNGAAHPALYQHQHHHQQQQAHLQAQQQYHHQQQQQQQQQQQSHPQSHQSLPHHQDHQQQQQQPQHQPQHHLQQQQFYPSAYAIVPPTSSSPYPTQPQAIGGQAHLAHPHAPQHVPNLNQEYGKAIGIVTGTGHHGGSTSMPPPSTLPAATGARRVFLPPQGHRTTGDRWPVALSDEQRQMREQYVQGASDES